MSISPLSIARMTRQVTAFGLSAVLTLGLLGSINVLAVQPVEQMMAAHAPVQMAAAPSAQAQS